MSRKNAIMDRNGQRSGRDREKGLWTHFCDFISFHEKNKHGKFIDSKAAAESRLFSIILSVTISHYGTPIDQPVQLNVSLCSSGNVFLLQLDVGCLMLPVFSQSPAGAEYLKYLAGCVKSPVLSEKSCCCFCNLYYPLHQKGSLYYPWIRTW